jgi:biopolymer transport protein ExbB
MHSLHADAARVWPYAIIDRLSFRMRSSFLFSIIQAAGWPIWPLVASSILALALIIERFISLKTAKVAPPRLLDEVLTVSRNGVPSPTWWCNSSATQRSGRSLASGFGRSTPTRVCSEAELRATMEGSGRLVAHRLEKLPQCPGHHCIGSAADGLFGTVVGMIEIFGSQGPSTVAHPAETRPNWRTAFRWPCTTRPSD